MQNPCENVVTIVLFKQANVWRFINGSVHLLCVVIAMRFTTLQFRLSKCKQESRIGMYKERQILSIISVGFVTSIKGFACIHTYNIAFEMNKFAARIALFPPCVFFSFFLGTYKYMSDYMTHVRHARIKTVCHTHFLSQEFIVAKRVLFRETIVSRKVFLVAYTHVPFHLAS